MDIPTEKESTDAEQSQGSQSDDNASDTEKPTKRIKRSRACIACRNMKIRCLPVEGQEACLACSKVNRDCVMPGPPRKRQKTVHRVAELEKKILALTDALLAKNAPADESNATQSPSLDLRTTASSEVQANRSTPMTELSYTKKLLEEAFPKGNPAYNPSCKPEEPDVPLKDSYVDLIERGVITMERATTMFNFWAKKMCSNCPMVVFPPDTEAEEVRTKRPVTFLAILTIASPLVAPTSHLDLNMELNKQLSERVLFHGEKSLDLVQAMILNSQFYARPRIGRDLAFNQYIHSAVVMCLELGLGRRNKVDPARSSQEMVELRRTWLACYYCASTVSSMLRHPALVRYNQHIDECMEVLSTSPAAAPSDRYLCALVSLARIGEEATVAFDMNDPCAELQFNDAKIQYQLRTFQRQLNTWEVSARSSEYPGVDPRLITHVANCIRLYVNEVAIHQDHDIDEFRIGVPTRGNRSKADEFVTSSHIASLATCLQCAHAVLDAYLSLEVTLARSLCNLFVVWNTYAVVVLIKLHGIINSADSRYGDLFAPEIRADYYLDSMLRKLAEVGAEGHNPCAEAFGFVFKKLKMWHLHRSGLAGEDEEGAEQQFTNKQVKRMLLRGYVGERPSMAELDDQEIRGNSPQSSLTAGLSGSASGPGGLSKSVFTAGAHFQNPLLPPSQMTGGSNQPGLPADSGIQHDIGASFQGGAMNPGTYGAPIANPTPWPARDLNAAYDAASYGRTNWDQFDFSREEMNLFDVYMNNSGWMGYLI